MTTYHIHINGQVQGVGFRPYVYQLAETMGIHGWITNSNDGVHIEFNATPGIAAQFYHTIVNTSPPHSIITYHDIHEVPSRLYSSFVIRQSTTHSKPDLLLTPDIAICDECKKEVLSVGNRWSNYPFTTCLHCGPRYSIITRLPYDRENTTMASIQTCEDCSAEYHDVHNRRHYSQTITCNNCRIPMHLYNSEGIEVTSDDATIVSTAVQLLKQGHIVAVKGIGGYLLLCDATNESSLTTLRNRKHRPSKPFALLYPTVEMIKGDAELRKFDARALKDTSAPIVLCKLKAASQNNICQQLIAPDLGRIGVMLPYTPLLLLISNSFGKPLVATSGNISGSPIIYKDNDALHSLSGIADYILTYDREIVSPQDDSVLQFTQSGQKIILRRSRGLAPNYYPNPFKNIDDTILAMGGELKSAFALLNNHNLYVSQFLGDQETVQSQTAYTESADHILGLLKAKPDRILIDKHPAYFVSALGKERAASENIPVSSIQHHKAHFAAVLAENNLLQSNDRVLGVIWDGTGYGDDKQIWGGEFFIYQGHEMHRVVHLDYFSQLLGDKMSREPRLSALSLLENFPEKRDLIKKHFSEKEWHFFQKQVRQPGQMVTSSMGRLIDGMASILGICQINTYEGEAAMKLEALASKYSHRTFQYYPIPIVNGRLDYNVMFQYIFEDLERKEDVDLIAWRIFCSLAKAVETVGEYFSIRKIAFSGGVFQNGLLNELVIDRLSSTNELYFHHQLSPNDECIGFGQIAYYEMFKKNLQTASEQKLLAVY